MALSSDALQRFKSETVRGVPGFFRVGQTHSGAWWLIGPDDLPFFARAVNDVQSAPDSPHDPAARLRAWDFNTLGAGSAVGLEPEGLTFVGVVNFCTSSTLIRAKGVWLPDVFDLGWSGATHQRAAEVCPAWTARRDLLGWLTDDELRWGGFDGSGRPSLLQICLSLEPSFAAYHAAWEFVLAPHGGQLARLAKAWGCSLENKEVLREATRAERGLATPGYVRDDGRWTREFAHRYFVTTSAAIRAHDPNHLVLGARDLRGATSRMNPPAWLAECVFPALDIAWIHSQDLKAAAPGPLFVGNFSWVNEPTASPPIRSHARGATSVERMLRRGRASLRAIIAQPAVVGYAWDAWSDGPGEQPPFARGLVHSNDIEAREHTELLSMVNRQIPLLRPFSTSTE